MDGTSFLRIAKGRKNIQWREYFLIERGKFPQKLLNPKPDKMGYLDDLCRDEMFQNPENGLCKPKQTHYCYKGLDEENPQWKITK